MKISASAVEVLATLLVFGTASGFVPNSQPQNPIFSQTATSPVSSSTECFASEVDIEATSESTKPPKFPFSDRQVRYAYDEWRLIYSKGDFDHERFVQFKRNYKTLVLSNLQARDKAAIDGRPVPQWMSLNEYGDYSIEEYEAMIKGETPVRNGAASMSYSSLSAGEPGEQVVRATQAIRQQGQARATQVVHSDYAMNYNNGQVREYQDQFGRTIRSTQPVHRDDSLVEAASRPVSSTIPISGNYANNIDGSVPETRGTLVIPNEENTTRGTQAISNRGTQVIGSRGTQVIQKVGGASTVRGTEALRTNGGASNIRGTQVVQPIDGRSDVRGTQVVSNIRGTQAVKKVEEARSDFGTQTVNGSAETNDSSGTQFVRSESDESSTPSSYGTQIIKETEPEQIDDRGTQVLQSADTEPESIDSESEPSAVGGTQVIPKSEGETEIPDELGVGTIVVEPTDSEKKASWSEIFGSVLFGDSEKKAVVEDNDLKEEEDDTVVGNRGTMVIKRSIPLPEEEKPKSLFNFFSPSETKEEEEASEIEAETLTDKKPVSNNSLFNFMNLKEKPSSTTGTPVPVEAEEAIDNDSESSGGIFSFFGGNVMSASSRPVRTTISLQKQPVSKPKTTSTIANSRKTQLIPEKESENGMPSILSFFGGAEKVTEEDTVRNPNSRPTLIVKKPKKNQFWSGFSTKKTIEESNDSPTGQKDKNDVIAAQIARQKEGVERAARRKAEIAKEREAKRQAMEEKRRDATLRREEEARKRAGRGTKAVAPVASSPTTMKATSPFNFFGAIGRQPTPPEMKGWKQNRDGTITGMIYGSKSFEDGTRITTSPVPKGAKGGTVVETSGGSKYSLT